MLSSESISCLLCRGVIALDEEIEGINVHVEDTRYKDHLKFEHKVFFFTHWIIQKTLEEEGFIEEEEEDSYENCEKNEKLDLVFGNLTKSVVVTKVSNDKIGESEDFLFIKNEKNSIST